MENDLLKHLTTYPLDKAASPASEDMISAFEADLGARLPTQYRRFLRMSGPIGIESGTRIPVGGGSELSVSALYGLGCKRSWDVRHQTVDVYAGRIPDETIPVGENGDTGDLVLLAIDGRQYGEVFVWWHDHPEIDDARISKMQQDLTAEGYDLSQMNIAAIIYTWEKAHADELGHAPLWGNIRRIAGSFEELLSAIAPRRRLD